VIEALLTYLLPLGRGSIIPVVVCRRASGDNRHEDRTYARRRRGPGYPGQRAEEQA
jgi:hypothetical protein